jgi:hypothetical protein
VHGSNRQSNASPSPLLGWLADQLARPSHVASFAHVVRAPRRAVAAAADVPTTQPPAKAAPLFGSQGAGGAKNDENFPDCLRMSTLRAEDVTLDMAYDQDELDAIDLWIKGLSAQRPASDTDLQKYMIRPGAAGLVHKFGVQPATACVGVYKEFGKKLEAKVRLLSPLLPSFLSPLSRVPSPIYSPLIRSPILSHILRSTPLC